MPILGSRGISPRGYGFAGAGKPNAPTSVVATDVGTARAFNNGAASVAFSSGGDNGAPITSFVVTSSPSGFTASGASSPIIVTGLASSTSYTFTVTATNSVGTSDASAASSAITATTVPFAPTIGTATGGNASATVTYTAGATGGKAITLFTATSTPSSITGTGASPITVSGLTNGTAFTFKVKATNANGTSAESAASNSVTPILPKAGYFAGGVENGPRLDSISKLTFSSETSLTLSATLTGARDGVGGFAHSGTAGYIVGGQPTVETNNVDKIAFSSDSKSTTASGLGQRLHNFASFANSPTAGYTAGSNVNSNVSLSSQFKKVTFATDSVSTVVANLNNGARTGQSGLSDNGVRGYIAGGSDGVGTFSNSITFLAFASENTGISAFLGTASSFHGAMSNSGVAGYFTGGSHASGSLSTTRKIIFSTSTTSTLSTGLSVDRTTMAGMALSGSNGYVSGGQPATGGFSNEIYRMSFSSDVLSLISATVGNVRCNHAGMANGL